MKRFEGIVIATDLDGTFFDSKGRTVERNLSAVKYFTANGGRFTIATGRLPSHVFSGFADVAEYVNMPLVTCNGSYIYDLRANSACSVYPIPYDRVKEIVELVESQYPMAGLIASSAECGLLCTPFSFENERIKRDFEWYSTVSRIVADVDDWRDQSVLKLVVRADAVTVSEMIVKFSQQFGDVFSVTQSSATYLEIQARGRNKGVALKELVSSMGDGMKLYTCGDYINDLEMHRAADVSVCPSNAHPRVIEECDLCLRTNDDGLIADLVDYIERKMQ